MENCGGAKQVMKIDSNVTMTLNKNCEIEVKGCGETTGFKTASASIDSIKNKKNITYCIDLTY